MKLVQTSLSIAITTALLTFSAQSFAENESQEKNNAIDEQSTEQEVIIVRSDFRQRNLQQSPTSLSIISEEDIKIRSAQNLEEIIASTPNVNFASGSQRARYYQIRGIGERSQFKEPINPSVGVMIDDIDFSGIGSISSTFDVAQTEVYRGPQGTRFGASAMAGLINLTTNAPTDTFEGAVRLTAGNYGSIGGGLVLSGPASDAVNYRLAVEQYQSDGFIENTYLGVDDTNNRDELTLRGKLAIQASKHLTVDLALVHFDFDNGYDAFSLDNTRETFSDQPGVDSQDTSALSSKFSYTGFNGIEALAIISYANSDLAYGYDEDWSNETLCQLNECIYGDYASQDYYYRDRETITGDFRLISAPNNRIFNQSTAWIAGVYFKQDNENLLRQYTYLASDYSSSFDTNTLAAYAEFETSFTDKLTLITGVRVEQRTADYINSDSFAYDPKDTMVGGKVVLSYQVDDNNLLYASINRGYKAGGVNTDGSLPDELRAFEPEYVLNYEAGYKVDLLNNNAFLRAAVFYMNRDDVQVNTSSTVVRPDGSAEFTAYIDNAAEGVNKGIEIDGAWHITDNVEIYGAFGYLATEFNGFINADGEDLSGRDQAHAPNYQFNLGVNYYLTDQWLVNVSADGKDSFYFSDSHDEKSDSVTLLNASISYLAKDYELRVWARNLLDEDYATRGFYFGNDPRDGYTAKGYQQYGEPMVFGVTLDYQF